MLLLMSALSIIRPEELWATDAPHLYGIRTGSQSHNGLRIVLDMETETPITIENGPKSSLIVRLSASSSPRFTEKNQAAPIKNIRFTSSGPLTTITFTCHRPYQVQRQFFIPAKGVVPTRYVIDLVPASSPPLTPSDSLAPHPIPDVAALPSTPKKKIIIDAGHGGRDSGSNSGTKESGRMLEKNITLMIAQRLAQKLSDTGQYVCILTRSKDEGMTLAQRLRKVRNAGGDLFLSIHADSCQHPDTRGLSIYTLSQVASDREAARLAQKENKADLNLGIDFKNELPEISNILIDLTKRETMNLSTAAAKELLKELGQNVFLLRRPHRFADFVVLRSPHVPSILIELGFLSNARDAALLRDPHYQDKMCDSIVRGIDRHFQKLT